MDNEQVSRNSESVYSTKVRAGRRRTYFFDIKRSKSDDHYVTITESTKRMNGGYDRHKIFLYKEDFNRFIESLQETIDFFKKDILPEYDYEEFSRRQEEYEAKLEAERLEKLENPDAAPEINTGGEAQEKEIREPVQPAKKKNIFEETDDDMSW